MLSLRAVSSIPMAGPLVGVEGMSDENSEAVMTWLREKTDRLRFFVDEAFYLDENPEENQPHANAYEYMREAMLHAIDLAAAWKLIAEAYVSQVKEKRDRKLRLLVDMAREEE
jgi:hypothetical protein